MFTVGRFSTQLPYNSNYLGRDLQYLILHVPIYSAFKIGINHFLQIYISILQKCQNSALKKTLNILSSQNFLLIFIFFQFLGILPVFQLIIWHNTLINAKFFPFG